MPLHSHCILEDGFGHPVERTQPFEELPEGTVADDALRVEELYLVVRIPFRGFEEGRPVLLRAMFAYWFCVVLTRLPPTTEPLSLFFRRASLPGPGPSAGLRRTRRPKTARHRLQA